MAPANLWHPERYHGLPPGHRFEGWYYKLVDADRTHPLAIIPGIFAGDDAHCFVQLLDGRSGRSTYVRYPCAAWKASTSSMQVTIDANSFGPSQLHLNLETHWGQVTGDLELGSLTPWPISPVAPGAMGPFAYLPGMECRHGILSFDHEITGFLTIGDSTLSYSRGRGYMEKDWGRGFPQAWIWMQTNHMAEEGASLSASLALVPFLGKAFTGFVVGLWWRQRLYAFATYNGALVSDLAVEDRNVRWTLERNVAREGATYRLAIQASTSQPTLLHGPMAGAMLARVPETLTGRIQVRLERHQGTRSETLFSDEGTCAGIEIVGDMRELARRLPRSSRRRLEPIR